MSPAIGKILVAGALGGLVIVVGEVVLNGWLLWPEWRNVREHLNLGNPNAALAAAGSLKLFLLGYVLVWLYLAFTPKFGSGHLTAVIAGLLVALLIWVWVMIGLLMAGYVTWTIAWLTMVWGLVELPTAAVVSAWFLDRPAAEQAQPAVPPTERG